MSLIPSIFSSDDSGAPALTGLAGSMAALLDALLIDGYGSGAGAKPGLGWTRAYTGTNLRAYRANPISGLGAYVRLDDTQVRLARLRTYLTMSAISTGTGMAPTTGQRTNGAQWVKSDTNDGAARKWWAIGNERCLYLFISPVGPDASGVEGHAVAVPYFFGRVVTRKPGDQFDFAVSPGIATYAPGSSIYNDIGSLFQSYGVGPNWYAGATADATFASVVLSRGYQQTGNPVVARCATDIAMNTQKWGGDSSYNVPYPDPVSLGLILSRGYLVEGVNLARARFPGLYVPSHFRPLPDLQIESNIPGLPGVQLLAKSYSHVPAGGELAGGQVFFDLTNPW